MSQTTALYQLQKLDSAIDRSRARVRELNEALAQNQAVQQAQAQVKELEDTLHPYEVRAVDLNLEVKTVGDQATQFAERLYGGHVHNPKELGDLQNKIAERKRHRAHLEDEMLETMIRTDELQAALAEARAQLSVIETAWNAQQQTLNDELHRVKHELKSHKAERQATAEAIAPANLELYEALRVQKRGQAVAVLEGDSCSVCRVEQTDNVIIQVRRSEQPVKCTSCGRILVAAG